MRLGNRNKKLACVVALITIDILAFYGALSSAFFTRKLLNIFFAGLITFKFSLGYYFRFWWMPLIFIVAIAYEKLYIKRLSLWDETRAMIKAVTASVIVIFAIVSLGKLSDLISRLVIVFLLLYGLVMFPTFRLLGKKILSAIGLWREYVIIIGAGKAGIETAQGIVREAHLGYKIIGFLDDADEKKDMEIRIDNTTYKVFGKARHFRKFVNLLHISTVIIAIPSLSLQKMSELTSAVQRYTKSVLLVPNLKGIALLNTELYHLFMQQLFLLKTNNNLKSLFNRFVKRSFDLAVAVLFSPILFLLVGVIGILVKIDSRGPVFYSHLRLGQKGKLIRVYKIRTMYLDATEKLKEFLEKDQSAKEEWGTFFKLKNDPRVTRIGKWLRETSLDELPQFMNIIKGDMSLVGPRPVLQEEIDYYYKEYADYYFMVKPGMTGLWQTSGRNIINYDYRVKLDTWYVLNWSLWFDIVILVKTIRVVLNKEGAY
ncbi:MAG: undecaprenyl-phosphate galactose phosphotransferase WbaP [Dissulfurispiraceae bacterium]